MSNRQEMEEGDVFLIRLDSNVWTVAQLCNMFSKSFRYSQYTFAFFNYKFASAGEAAEKAKSDAALDFKWPIAIFTINGHPLKRHGLKFLANRDIAYENAPNFKKDISSLFGMYKNTSYDFPDILKAFFGILPWDCFYKDDYIDKILLKDAQKRDDVKYMKDFSIDELKRLLPPDSLKLNKLLGKH
ncbi:MAG: hypothetical protein FWG66_08075 [Spirochaetes bacterium]|nr:hypothetical protein [Spirochaetota bacterium]